MEIEDHPRSRGVYLDLGVRGVCGAGSSPLARGLLKDTASMMWTDRIIPARAGFTVSKSATLAFRADHPRSRGVYEYVPAGKHGDDGSSPLARGLRPFPLFSGRGRRIIPARAGFTSPCRTLEWRRPDHPRSRGVYRHYSLDHAFFSGSSPLARGLRRNVCARKRRLRIIPARAGFTAHPPTSCRPPPDHPRSRGVYSNQTRMVISRRGSSPLARGLHFRLDGSIVLIRIIPARAGFTPHSRPPPPALQ